MPAKKQLLIAIVQDFVEKLIDPFKTTIPLIVTEAPKPPINMKHFPFCITHNGEITLFSGSFSGEGGISGTL